MARKKYIVELTAEERQTLEQLLQKGKSSARKLTRARILLKADEGLEEEAIAEAVGTSVATIERTRHRFVERNLEALNELPRPGGQPKLSGKQAAQLIAVACTPAPRGRVRWTLALLAEQVVELGVTDSIGSRASVPVTWVRQQTRHFCELVHRVMARSYSLPVRPA